MVSRSRDRRRSRAVVAASGRSALPGEARRAQPPGGGGGRRRGARGVGRLKSDLAIARRDRGDATIGGCPAASGPPPSPTALEGPPRECFFARSVLGLAYS